jgi:hypothetical protein
MGPDHYAGGSARMKKVLKLRTLIKLRRNWRKLRRNWRQYLHFD